MLAAEIDFAGFVLAECLDVAVDGIAAVDLELREAPRSGFEFLQSEQDSFGCREILGVISEDIVALCLGDGRAAIQETAGDGNAELREFRLAFDDAGVGVLRDGAEGRNAERRRIDGKVRDEGALEVAPAVVTAFFDDIHFLDFTLAHVRAKETAGDAIEGETPRIAQAPGPDFLAHTGHAHEGIVGGDAVLAAGAPGAAGAVRAEGVEAQDFSEQMGAVLRVAQGVGGTR